jgi:hypothetical protein
MPRCLTWIFGYITGWLEVDAKLLRWDVGQACSRMTVLVIIDERGWPIL